MKDQLRNLSFIIPYETDLRVNDSREKLRLGFCIDFTFGLTCRLNHHLLALFGDRKHEGGRKFIVTYITLQYFGIQLGLCSLFLWFPKQKLFVE